MECAALLEVYPNAAIRMIKVAKLPASSSHDLDGPGEIWKVGCCSMTASFFTRFGKSRIGVDCTVKTLADDDVGLGSGITEVLDLQDQAGTYRQYRR
jgi:hypothetical protein